jgi:hypothetical protein
MKHKMEKGLVGWTKYLGLPVKMEMEKDKMENVKILNQEIVKAHGLKLGLPVPLDHPRKGPPSQMHLQLSKQASN